MNKKSGLYTFLKGMLFLMALFLMVGVQEKKALAGTINSNEASVLSAAGSVFEYKGEKYVAAPQYLDKLRNKLASDDVDLDADAAAGAISSIYDNIEVGVNDGYLLKLDTTSETTDNSVENQDNLVQQSSDKDKKDKSDKKKDSDKKDSDKDGDSDASVAATLEPDDSSDKLDELTKIDVESDMTVIDNEVNQIEIAGDKYEFATSVPVTTVAVKDSQKFKVDFDAAAKSLKLLDQTEPEQVAQSLREDFVYPIIKVSLIPLIVLFVVLLVYLVFKKRFDIKKIVVSAVASLFMITGLVIFTGSFLGIHIFASPDVLISDIAQEKYYNKVYSSLNENVNNLIVSAGYDEGSLSDLINERNVYMNGKLSLEATFNSNRSTDFLDIQDTVYEILSHKVVENGYLYTQEVKTATTNVSGLVQTAYRDSLKFTYAQKLAERVKEIRKNLIISCVAGFLLFLIGLFILFFTQKYYHRICRLVGFVFCICAVSEGLSVALYVATNKIKNLELVPGNYRDFFVYYISHAEEFISALSIIMLIFAVGLIVLTFLFKGENKQNKFAKFLF